MTMRLFVLALCFIFISVFSAVDVSARPPCPKVWVEGHYNHHGKWIRPHWKRQHYVAGHYRHGQWVPGHCK